jgi:hypothetical protein
MGSGSFFDPLTPGQEAQLDAIGDVAFEPAPGTTAGKFPGRSRGNEPGRAVGKRAPRPSKVTLGYPFVPLPRSAFAALASGQLTDDDLRILLGLYARASFATLHVRVTLAQLATAIGWDHSLDYLSKRLRGLRRGGWIVYSVSMGRHRAIYEIALQPQNEASDQRPRNDPLARPRRRTAKGGIKRATAARGVALPSEDGVPPAGVDGPSDGGNRPSSDAPPEPRTEPDTGAARGQEVRAAQTVQRKAKDLYKGSETERQLRLDVGAERWRDLG